MSDLVIDTCPADLVGHVTNELVEQRQANAQGYDREAALPELRKVLVEHAQGRGERFISAPALREIYRDAAPERRAHIVALLTRAGITTTEEN
jgi:hypothetical protein